MGRSAEAEPKRRIELTQKQREVLALIGRGLTNAQIAEQLGISLDGAKWHVREILGKLGVDSREEAADWWNAQNGALARAGRRTRRALSVLGLRWLAGGATAAVLAGGSLAIYDVLHDDHGTPPLAATALPSTSTAQNPGSTTTANAAVPLVSPSPTSTATAPTVISGFIPRALAFIRDGNLWVADLDSTPPSREVEVTDGGGLSNPSWSFTGRYVAVWGFGHVWPCLPRPSPFPSPCHGV